MEGLRNPLILNSPFENRLCEKAEADTAKSKAISKYFISCFFDAAKVAAVGQESTGQMSNNKESADIFADPAKVARGNPKHRGQVLQWNLLKQMRFLP